MEGGAGGVATGRPIVLGGPAKELGRISLPVWELLGSWAGRERLPGGWADLEVTGVMLPWNRSYCVAVNRSEMSHLLTVGSVVGQR